jgi:hypothetical protein
MTIRQFTDDYIEAKGLRIIQLARVTGEPTSLLNLHYSQGNTLGFLYECAHHSCILIKYKVLMRQFFGRVEDLDDELLLAYWNDTDEWFDIDNNSIMMIADKVVTNLEKLYHD